RLLGRILVFLLQERRHLALQQHLLGEETRAAETLLLDVLLDQEARRTQSLVDQTSELVLAIDATMHLERQNTRSTVLLVIFGEVRERNKENHTHTHTHTHTTVCSYSVFMNAWSRTVAMTSLKVIFEVNVCP